MNQSRVTLKLREALPRLIRHSVIMQGMGICVVAVGEGHKREKVRDKREKQLGNSS